MIQRKFDVGTCVQNFQTQQFAQRNSRTSKERLLIIRNCFDLGASESHYKISTPVSSAVGTAQISTGDRRSCSITLGAHHGRLANHCGGSQSHMSEACVQTPTSGLHKYYVYSYVRRGGVACRHSPPHSKLGPGNCAR